MPVFYDFTPLQILTLCSMEAKNIMSIAKEELLSDEESEDKMDYIKDLVHDIADAIGNCTELLVRSGGRLDGLDAPQEIPNKLTTSPSSSSFSSSIHKLDRSKLKLDGSDQLFLSLGGKERLRAAQRQWSKHTVVQGTGKIILRNKDAFSSNNNAKSSDTIKECAICGVSFGILRHRKHTCRVSGRMVCEHCSSKRIQEGGDEFRVSDGQFLRGLVEAKLHKSRELKMEQEKRQARKQRLANLAGKRYGGGVGSGSGSSVAQQEMEAENQKKKELFGGNIKNAVVNFFMEEVSQEEQQESSLSQQQQQQRQLDGLASKMGETKDALLERGQKLNTLADKTSALAEQSKNFADMAKELRQQQEKGFFSFFD